MSQLKALINAKKITVLIIDDEARLLDSLSSYLESQGISVLTATSTIKALKILNHTIPDLLIIDVMMPFETGYQFVNKLKEIKLFAPIPYIFLTARGMTKDRIKGYSLGCKAYITKPFDPDELFSVINNILNEKKDIHNIKHIRNEIKKIRLCLENKNKNYIELSFQEKIILHGVIENKTNNMIAKELRVSTRNIEKYLTKLFHKTNSRNRIDLINFANEFYNNLKANDENRTRE